MDLAASIAYRYQIRFKQFNRATAGMLSLVTGTGRGGPRVIQASLQFGL